MIDRLLCSDRLDLHRSVIRYIGNHNLGVCSSSSVERTWRDWTEASPTNALARSTGYVTFSDFRNLCEFVRIHRSRDDNVSAEDRYTIPLFTALRYAFRRNDTPDVATRDVRVVATKPYHDFDFSDAILISHDRPITRDVSTSTTDLLSLPVFPREHYWRTVIDSDAYSVTTTPASALYTDSASRSTRSSCSNSERQTMMADEILREGG
jgi:hypothetical protein